MNALSLAAWSAALFAASALFTHNVALRLLLLVIAATCAIAAALRHRRELRLLPPVWWAFLLWGAWSALSLVWSVEPARSEKEFRNEVIYTALALWASFIAAQAPRAMRVFLPVGAAALGLLCVLALHDYAQGFERYLSGWHGGPGDLSSALLTAMPCVLAVGWYACKQERYGVAGLAAGLCVLSLAAAYTTMNRTIWAGFSIQLLLLVAFLSMRQQLRDARVRSMVAVLVLPLIAAFAVTALHVQERREIADALAAPERDPRAKIWSQVTQRIFDAPLAGYGFGRGLLREELATETQAQMHWHAHNLFLDTALQTGIPGLVLLVLLVALLLRESLAVILSKGDDLRAACAFALLGASAGMVARNLTDTLFVRQNALLFWSVVGLLLAWMAALRGSPRT